MVKKLITKNEVELLKSIQSIFFLKGKCNTPRMITLVVPSPHSSSCVRLNSIIFFAAGCATSISRNIAFPSFVRLFKKRFQSGQCTTEEEEKGAYSIPPIGSRIIFNMDLGPRHVRMTSATVHTVTQKIKKHSIRSCPLIHTLAAVMFEI